MVLAVLRTDSPKLMNIRDWLARFRRSRHWSEKVQKCQSFFCFNHKAQNAPNTTNRAWHGGVIDDATNFASPFSFHIPLSSAASRAPNFYILVTLLHFKTMAKVTGVEDQVKISLLTPVNILGEMGETSCQLLLTWLRIQPLAGGPVPGLGG